MIRALLRVLDASRGTEPCALCAAQVRTRLMSEHLRWHHSEALAHWRSAGGDLFGDLPRPTPPTNGGRQ